MRALKEVDRRLAAALHLPERHRGRLEAVQRLSHTGDHAAIWLAAGAVGAAADRRRRAQWLRAAAAVLLAHGSATLVKRANGRSRPAPLPWVTSASTPSARSFPSSHATSSTAAAVAYAGLVPAAVRLPLAGGVMWSRLALGLHWPSDVVAGAALGGLVALAVRR